MGSGRGEDANNTDDQIAAPRSLRPARRPTGPQRDHGTGLGRSFVGYRGRWSALSNQAIRLSVQTCIVGAMASGLSRLPMLRSTSLGLSASRHVSGVPQLPQKWRNALAEGRSAARLALVI